jgi:hypothetical protein
VASLAFGLAVIVAAVGGVGLQPWRTATSVAATGGTDGSLAAACPNPRPPVHVSVSRVSATSLGVQITAGWGALQSLRFGPASNAIVSVPGWPDSATGGFDVTFTGGTTSASFALRQGPAEAAVTVPLTVRDGCGDWPTFVGGGVSAWPTQVLTPGSTPVVPTRTVPAASATATPPTGTANATTTPTTTPTATKTATKTQTTTPPSGSAPVLERFEGQPASWQVQTDASGSGSVQRSSAVAAAEGSFAARAATAGGGRADVRVSFQNPAARHGWEERPGDWQWQRASVYVPASTVSALGPGSYLTLGRLWASGAGYGWSLRLRQNGALSVVGQRDSDNTPVEFHVYGQVPVDRWFELELGLHSQGGPGVKRAFAFLIDGTFYGWYHQGRMQNETYDEASIGIVETNSGSPLEILVDQWRTATSASLPDGPDTRPTAAVQEIDYRAQSGERWQIDWTTWANDLRLTPTHGLYSATDRLQSGQNLDRMPDLTSGWAEIEIGWPNGTPSNRTPADASYFGPMVGFRKEINREQNLEVIPIGRGSGRVGLAFEVWDGNGPTVVAEWPLPLASVGGGTHIPEDGDIIRARWDQVSPTQLRVRASYYDASAAQWLTDVIDTTVNPSSLAGLNYNDGFHLASSVTTDSTAYSIRRFRVGQPATYPTP